MDSLASPAPLDSSSDSISCCLEENVSAPVRTGHAFLRKAEVVQSVPYLDTGDQSDNLERGRHIRPERKWLQDYPANNQTGYNNTSTPLPITDSTNPFKPLKNDQSPVYALEQETFSIQSLLGRWQSTLQNSSLEDTFLESYEKSEARYEASDKLRESKARYKASDKLRESKARYGASDKLRESKARYKASDKLRESKARYEASDKGKKTRARYRASDKGKVARDRASARYYASEKGKVTRERASARYYASDKGKRSNAINNAKSNAYRSALRKGLSEEAAREIGNVAANAKKAELLSVFPPPFKRQTEEMFTAPTETLSP